jgi:hypothetical protein
MAKQPVKESKILIDGMNPFSLWINGVYPFDKAKACHACVTQHAMECDMASHQALKKAVRELTEPWDSLSPQTEEQAQQILLLRRKFYRFFAPEPK